MGPDTFLSPPALIETVSIFEVGAGTQGLEKGASLTESGEAGPEDPQPLLSAATSALPLRG